MVLVLSIVLWPFTPASIPSCILRSQCVFICKLIVIVSKDSRCFVDLIFCQMIFKKLELNYK